MGHESSSNQTVQSQTTSNVSTDNIPPFPPQLQLSLTPQPLSNTKSRSLLTPRMSLPLTPSTSNSKYTHKRGSSAIVSNTVTGIYISSRICKIAAQFWQHRIDTLSAPQQLEIACSIFFSMMSANAEMKAIMKSSTKRTVEQKSLKYLDMMGWLMRHLVIDNMDLYELLLKLGAMHQNFGVNIKHFNPMLQAIHETFSYYFGVAYTIEIKYAMDEIFSLAAQIMTGQELKCNSHLNSITQEFLGGDIAFLKNLEVCLASSIGREYFYLYLSQTWCDEIALFLKALFRFKSLTSDKERYMVARHITKTSIQTKAPFTLNLSHDNRINALNKMAELNEKFACKQMFEVETDFFSEVERETYQLIMENHWVKFVRGIKVLQSKSLSVE